MSEEVAKRMLEKLRSFKNGNEIKLKYYEGRAVPKAKRNKETVTPCPSVGWASIIVESLNDRINIDGIETNSEKAKNIFKNSSIQGLSSQVHRDALIFGSSYILAQPGNVSMGEPSVIITSESPMNCYGEEDRLGNIEKLIIFKKIGDKKFVSLIEKDFNEYYEILDDGMVFLSRDDHGIGFVPCVKLANKKTAFNLMGQSEISYTLRRIIDQALTTYDNMNDAAELYAAPTRYMINVPEGLFFDEDGNSTGFGQSYISKMQVITASDDPNAPKPEFGQWTPSSPQPYLDQIKQYASEFSAISGVPMSSLGYNSTQAVSSESILAMNDILIKKAEDKTASFSEAWKKILIYAMILDGTYDQDVKIAVQWRNPRITARSSLVQADGITKLIQAGVLQPNSAITYRYLGFDQETVELAQREAEDNMNDLIAQQAAELLNNIGE